MFLVVTNDQNNEFYVLSKKNLTSNFRKRSKIPKTSLDLGRKVHLLKIKGGGALNKWMATLVWIVQPVHVHSWPYNLGSC